MQKTIIRIKPFPKSTGLGNEQWGQGLFEGGGQTEQMACLEGVADVQSTYRYLTGLDEYSRAVQTIEDEVAKKTKIKEIREKVADLTAKIFGIVVDPADKEFWTKTPLVATNLNFYAGSKFEVILTNEGKELDLNDPYQVIIYESIKAGGYSLIAPNLADAKISNNYSFYLDVSGESLKVEVEFRSKKTRAKGLVYSLKQDNPQKLLAIMRILDNPDEYKKSTPADVIFTNADMYIDGERSESNIKVAIDKFLKLADKDSKNKDITPMSELVVRSLISCAKYYKYLDCRADGKWYYMKEGVVLGRSEEEVLGFLSNPSNDDILSKLEKEVNDRLND